MKNFDLPFSLDVENFYNLYCWCHHSQSGGRYVSTYWLQKSTNGIFLLHHTF